MGCSFTCKTEEGLSGWQCTDDSKTCVGGSQTCDETSNCPSGSDEAGCGTASSSF